MHHFDGAAGEAKCHGPEGALAGPVGDLVECCSVGVVSEMRLPFCGVATKEKECVREYVFV